MRIIRMGLTGKLLFVSTMCCCYLLTSTATSHHNRYPSSVQQRQTDKYLQASTSITDMDAELHLQRTRIRRDTETMTESGRMLSPDAFSRISETLGALNTVGRYLVNMTRGGQEPKPHKLNGDVTPVPDDFGVPNALLTLTKNMLGQNVTRTIEPLLIKRVDEPTKTGIHTDDHVQTIDAKKKKKKLKKDDLVQASASGSEKVVKVEKATNVQAKDGESRCRTPEGRPGRCEDLSNCPGLLLDLGALRESLCFKSLFVPGVCCPIIESTVLTTARPTILTPRPPVTTSQSLILKPHKTTTIRPLLPVFTITTKPVIQISSNNSSSSSSSNPSISDLDDIAPNLIDPSDCGQQEHTSGRIVGGVQSANGQWPWMAAIFLHGAKRTEFWCGGSLIGTKYILTAAHCTRDSRQRPFAARQFTVRLGDIDLSSDKEPSAPVTFKVKEVRAHSRFSRVGFYNDIAILVLDKPVRKSRYVIPVCLPRSNMVPKERLPGRRGTVVGWGTTYYGGKESTVQREADLPIWRNEDCNRAYFQPITENFLCAGYSEGGVDACQGDSGGPLMMNIDTRWTQLGIVSFGNKCGEPGYPGVYTRLTEYADWIKENTRN